jgi:hypothetical protein
MAGSSKAIRDWYANRLKEHYGAAYSISQEGGDPGTTHPQDSELSPSAVRADRAKMPRAVREAYEFYKKHFEDEDTGSARDYVVPVAGKKTYAIRVRTDGDDGYLEVYDGKGRLLAAGRTYIEIVAWGSRKWLRAQVARPGELPPELQDAGERTLWGKPLPKD